MTTTMVFAPAAGDASPGGCEPGDHCAFENGRSRLAYPVFSLHG